MKGMMVREEGGDAVVADVQLLPRQDRSTNSTNALNKCVT